MVVAAAPLCYSRDFVKTHSATALRVRQWRPGTLLLALLLAVAGLVSFEPLQPVAVFAADASAPAGASTYLPLATPKRLADTRQGTSSVARWINANTLRVKVTRPEFGLPSGVTTAVLNVVTLNARAATFVTAYPAGTARPVASNVNATPGQVVANMVTVKLSAAGEVDIYTLQPASLVVDLSGVYVTASASGTKAGRLVTFPGGAVRAYDSRVAPWARARLASGETIRVPLGSYGVPATASAVVVNVTATEADVGYLTVYPVSGAMPDTSTLNLDRANQTRAAQAIVRLDPAGDPFDPPSSSPRKLNIKIFSLKRTHVIVDVVGYFTGDTAATSIDGMFVPREPYRLGDTRNGDAITGRQGSIAPWPRTAVEFGVPPILPGINAAAAAVNLTVTGSTAAGYVVAYPAGQSIPNSSNLNVTGWDQTIANHAIVRLGSRPGNSATAIDLYTSHGTQMIADLAGWYLGAPSVGSAPVQRGPSYGPSQVELVYAEDMPVNTRMVNGVGQAGSRGQLLAVGVPKSNSQAALDTVANGGKAVGYLGYTNAASPGNVMLFAHRTSHGGPWYFINSARVGTDIRISARLPGTNTVVVYRYRIVRRDITAANAATIDNIARSVGAPMTLQLIACHPLHYTYQRYVLTARFVGIG